MPSSQRRTFSLPDEAAGYIDTMVATGAYTSDSEVVGAGLRALQDRDAEVERWLRDEVIPTYDAMETHPERVLSADDVSARLRAHHAEHVAKTVREP